MGDAAYGRFLPERYRTPPVAEPRSTWWQWRGRRVHIARAPRPDAGVRLLVIHGAGGYSGALWPIAGLAARDGAEVLAPDLPLYGDTVEPRRGAVRYPDWLDLLCDLVTAEQATDDRPLAVLGASMGGLLGYEVAARTGTIAHVLATCLLDPADPDARRAAARISATAPIAAPVLRTVEPLVGDVRVPVRWLVDMGNMSRNRDLSRLCATDPKGGGVRVPLGFLASWLDFTHTAPESFRTTPVTLVHPAADAWTPAALSIRFLDRLAAPTRLVLLEQCGHYPIEEPGLSQLLATLRSVSEELGGAPR